MTDQLTQDVQELKNDALSVKITKQPGCRVLLDITVQPAGVEAAYEKAFKNVRKEVSIPGFRKGKVPDEIILKNYASHIEREWKDIVLQTAFQEAVILTKAIPLSKNSVKRSQLKKCSKTEGAEAHFEYEAEPIIPTIDVKRLQTKPVIARAVTDDDIEWELKKHRMNNATFEDVTDRPVQEGDFVEIDVDVIEDPAHNVFTNRLFHVTPDDMPKWAYNEIIGMQVNEAKEAKATLDTCDDKRSFIPHVHSESCGHNEPKLCRILLTAIKKGVLPDANDDLAKKYNLESMDEMRKKIRELLERMTKEMAQDATRSQIQEELSQLYPIDVPQTLFNAEVTARLRHLKQASHQKDGALPMSEAQEKSLKTTLEAIVYDFLSSMYLLNSIIQKEKFQVSQEEFLQEVTAETSHLPPEHRLVFPGIDMNEARNRMFMRVTMRKAIDHIISQLH